MDKVQWVQHFGQTHKQPSGVLYENFNYFPYAINTFPKSFKMLPAVKDSGGNGCYAGYDPAYRG